MTSSKGLSSKLENMINFRFTKSNWPKLPQSDPSFYKRFNRAWTNLRENELEANLKTLKVRVNPTR
jgi:hypothetical protein